MKWEFSFQIYFLQKKEGGGNWSFFSKMNERFCTKEECDELCSSWNYLKKLYKTRALTAEDIIKLGIVLDTVFYKHYPFCVASLWMDMSCFGKLVLVSSEIQGQMHLCKTLHTIMLSLLRKYRLVPPELVDTEESAVIMPLNEQVFWLFHSCYEARLLDAPIRLLPLLGVLGRPDHCNTRVELAQARIIDDLVNQNVSERNLLLVKQLLEKYLEKKL